MSARSRRLSFRSVIQFVGAFFALFAISCGAVTAQELRVNLTGSVYETTVRPGTTVTVRTNRTFNDIVVGNPGVADVVPLSDQSLYIQGGSVGITTISLYDAEKALLGVIEVRVETDFSDAAAAIRSAVPDSQVRVANINNRLRLTGVVKNSVDMDRVVRIANQYSETVINALRVSDPQQVTLEVRVLEAKRSAGENLGIKLNINDKFTSRSPTSDQTPFFGNLVAQILSAGGVDIDLTISALEKRSVIRRLAQPNLTAVSGEGARFNVGGEVPITRVVQGDNGSTAAETAYRPYGVRLEFVPTVLDEGKINIRVLTEVSDIDPSRDSINPSFLTRTAETVVELRDGQSFALAGLIKVDNDRAKEQVPGLGAVPVLGALFRSSSFTKEETDLVIIVTPRLTRPAAPDEPLFSPLDQTRPSNDVELFALGLLEVDKDMMRRFRTGEGIIGPYGHIIDLEFDDGIIAKK
ncbi:type II and III secretion system protein family protein [Oricola cellulosilytica]|uniref:Type II and III secretion system protein family protein n=2 Tax=Oricola cellulosilytica TaxID=1429082 RepID=A0A4R0PFU1_9HYPH|nr:type II and III secretion system protein family protein [Oricola cellulosilytica]